MGKGWLREYEMLWRKAVRPNMLGLDQIGVLVAGKSGGFGR